MADVANTNQVEGDQPAFELFPKLPIELRLKIFRMAARGPRIIELGYNQAQGIIFQQQLTPPLFRTCNESREELLRGTKLLLCDEVDNQRILMNFESDVLYIPARTLESIRMGTSLHPTCFLFRILDELSEEALQSIKCLALDYLVLDDMHYGSRYHQYPGDRDPNLSSLIRFRNLEKFSAIFPMGGGQEDDNSTGPFTQSYQFKPYEDALEKIKDLRPRYTLRGHPIHPLLEPPRNFMRDMAANEHIKCPSTCSHLDKWKVPEIEMVLRIPIRPVLGKEPKIFSRQLRIEEKPLMGEGKELEDFNPQLEVEKGPWRWLMKKCWTKMVGVCSGVFCRSG